MYYVELEKELKEVKSDPINLQYYTKDSQPMLKWGRSNNESRGSFIWWGKRSLSMIMFYHRGNKRRGNTPPQQEEDPPRQNTMDGAEQKGRQ